MLLNMIKSIIFASCMVLALGQSPPSWLFGNRECVHVETQRRIPNGQEFDWGNFWYRCDDGRYEEIGCKSIVDDRRMQPGDHYVKDRFAFKCHVEYNEASFKSSGCAPDGANGRIYVDNEEFEDPIHDVYYRCVQDRDGEYREEIGGCLTKFTKIKVPFLEYHTENNKWYQCGTERQKVVDRNGFISRTVPCELLCRGCVDSYSQKRKLNEIWTFGNSKFTCTGECEIKTEQIGFQV